MSTVSSKLRVACYYKDSASHNDLIQIIFICFLFIIGIPATHSGQLFEFESKLLLNSQGTGDVGDDLAPRIATDGYGTWISVWHSSEDLNGELGSDFDVLYSISVDVGSSWTSPSALNSEAGFDLRNEIAPAIDTDELETWSVAWTTSDTNEIFYSRSDDRGASWSSQQPISTSGIPTSKVELVYCGNLVWMMLWNQNDQIFGSRSDDNALTWSQGFLLSSIPPLGDPENQVGVLDCTPRGASDQDGNVIVLQPFRTFYPDISHSPNISNLYRTQTTNGGMDWTDPLEFIINVGARRNFEAHIKSDNLGRWMAVWSSNASVDPPTPPDPLVHAGISFDDGNTWSSMIITGEFDMAGPPVGAGYEMPRVVTDRQGVWLVVIQNNFPRAFVDLSQPSVVADEIRIGLAPDVATDRNGNWIIVWQDVSSQSEFDQDIYYSTGMKRNALSPDAVWQNYQ